MTDYERVYCTALETGDKLEVLCYKDYPSGIIDDKVIQLLNIHKDGVVFAWMLTPDDAALIIKGLELAIQRAAHYGFPEER